MSRQGFDRSRPTLLVLASTYPRWQGDTEPAFIHELCRRLAAKFEVIVLCPHAPGAAARETMNDVEVVRYRYAPERWERLVNDGGIVTNLKRHRWMVALIPSFFLMQAWYAWRLLRRHHVSVIHAHWLIPQGLIASLVACGRRTPYVITSHGADLYALRGKVLDSIKRYVLRHAASASVVSSAMRKKLEAIGAAVDRVHVLPMGVDLLERFTPTSNRSRQPKELLFVGRLVEKKGLRHLIAVLPRILDRHKDARLTIAGFGPEADALRAQVQSLGLAGRVDFLGAVQQTELPALYRRAGLFVAPFVPASSGDQEGLPVALMEAVGCGCPMVVGNVPGLEDIFGTAVAEFTVDPRDYEALAERILSVLDDPQGAQARVLEIREQMHGQIDWSVAAARYATLLHQAASD